jgi:hypothetical protein
MKDKEIRIFDYSTIYELSGGNNFAPAKNIDGTNMLFQIYPQKILAQYDYEVGKWRRIGYWSKNKFHYYNDDSFVEGDILYTIIRPSDQLGKYSGINWLSEEDYIKSNGKQNELE